MRKNACASAAHRGRTLMAAIRSRFLLLPVAALTIAVPAHATVYLSVEQAQALMFPGESLTPDFRTLTDAQVSAIADASDTHVRNTALKAWRASGGGWFLTDQVVGKHEFIPIALALDANGAVKDVEILEYRESFWRRSPQSQMARAVHGQAQWRHR